MKKLVLVRLVLKKIIKSTFPKFKIALAAPRSPKGEVQRTWITRNYAGRVRGASAGIILLFLLLTTNIQAQLTLQDSLVAYYPFNGNALDSTDNNNDGTVNGATLTTDSFGNADAAYSFDEVDDVINNY